jgi:hypothetical protein
MRSGNFLPANCASRSVCDKKVARATAYFTGLGISELYLNGEKVGDACSLRA